MRPISFKRHRFTLRTHGLIKALGLEPASGASGKLPMQLTETIPARLKRSGRAIRLLLPGNVAANAGEPDRALVNTIVRAQDWWNTLCGTPGMTIEALARQQGVTASYVTRIVRLAFLAPDVMDRAIGGTLPARTDVKHLTSAPLPICWDAQRALLGC